MFLADHGVNIVSGEDDDVNWWGMVGNTDGTWLGAVLLVVKCNDGREDTWEDAMKHDGAVPVEENADALVLYHADQGRWNKGVEAG